jgi:hypothetical protein
MLATVRVDPRKLRDWELGNTPRRVVGNMSSPLPSVDVGTGVSVLKTVVRIFKLGV